MVNSTVPAGAPAPDGVSEATKIGVIDKSKDGGAEKAYQAFHSDVYTYSQSHSTDDTKKFVDQANESFVKSGVLPDLAVAWAKDDGLNSYSDSNHTLSGLSLKAAESDGRNPQNADDILAGTFGKALEDKNSFKKSTGSDTYNDSNLNKYLDKQGKDNVQAANELEARDGLAPLFQGTPSLFKVLDAQNGGGTDGKISKNDLQSFMNSYNAITDNGKNAGPAGSPYSADNAKFVDDLIHGRNNLGVYVNLNGSFTRDDIGHAAGVPSGKSDDEFVTNYNNIRKEDDTRRQAASSVSTTSAPSTAGGGGSSVM
jgi:hypothetical protein